MINENDNSSSSKSNLKVLDLFCGCGGMSRGLEDAGLNIMAGLDIWDKAIDSYTQNFDHLGVCEDISKLSPETFNTKYKIEKDSIDIIVGGPPCQGFSIAGKRDKKTPKMGVFYNL